MSLEWNEATITLVNPLTLGEICLSYGETQSL